MSSWQRFWWWSGGNTWPTDVKDVLKDSFGTCPSNAIYCFQRIPSYADEDSTELLAIDSDGTVYQWKFDSKNPTAHAAWLAFHDHQTTPHGKIKNAAAWDPVVREGSKPKAPQDSFMYREQNGVKSILLDDDNCDCLSTLSMGHGMCNAGHSTAYGAANVYGVDKLHDPACNGPKPSAGLTLYFRTERKLSLEEFGGDWRAFWWWTKDAAWPAQVRDVLENANGACTKYNYYCFQTLPSWLREDSTELLAVDTRGTVYKWSFDSSNPTSHAVWRALHDHQESFHKAVLNSSPWNPTVLKGKAPKLTQDAFMYRNQNGVKSLLLDDDNCDCLSSLNLGHGMCNDGHSTSYSKNNVFGVDALYDDGCNGPVQSVGLTLYYRVRRSLEMQAFNETWKAFWWWTAGVQWPSCSDENAVLDVLEHAYGTCSVSDAYCFQRLPAWTEEGSTEMLAKDSVGTVYKWSFDPANPTAHATWKAFHNHQETSAGAVKNQKAWNPVGVKGKPPIMSQDSFMYRTQGNIKSVLLDDDNCDCLSSLSLGHSMCGNTGKKALGVDVLYDPHCTLPSHHVGLTLYVKEPELPMSFRGYGKTWTAFWWWPKDGAWPAPGLDVLENPYGSCKDTDVYCFQRLPSEAEEDRTSLLAIDTEGNVYEWKFASSNPTAHAAWSAFHDHVETLHKTVLNNKPWAPTVLKGTPPKAAQDSFMYRDQNGVKSLLLDDDNCDCLSTLSMGHGMCSAGFSTSYGPANRYGVDALYDNHCNTPRPGVGLALYFSVSKAARPMTLCAHGGSWLAFWWWTAGATWPSKESDVLSYSYGHCSPFDLFCFGRIASWAREDSTELLVVDSVGNEYLWKFDPANPVAHAAWQAFHDHVTTAAGAVLNKSPAWNPTVLSGTKPTAVQDSFMYREQNGVKSILLDDDNCDCLTSLNIGHGMCRAGHSTSNGPSGQFGVDALYDPGCNVPQPDVGLTMYFRVN